MITYSDDAWYIPNSITIITEKDKLYEVKYENYTIASKKIRIDGRDEVVYCLEIDKGYPSGQTFNLTGNPPKRRLTT